MMTMPKSKLAPQSGGPTQTERSWIPILADWKKSGLGIREFCRRRRIQGRFHMELFNRSESLRRQERIAREAQPLAEAVLARAGAYPELAEQLYLLGTTVLPLLRAGHYLASERMGTAQADRWLGEHLRVLAEMLSEGSGRSLTISVSGTSKS